MIVNRFALVALLAISSAVFAQPPGFGGRGGFGGGGRGGAPGGGGFGGRGGGGEDRANDFRRRMMERMDENGNGKLEENEVSSRARGFLEGMVRQSGKELKFPLSIAEVAGGSSGRSRDRGSRRGRDDDKKDEEFKYPLVSRFGEETTYTSFGVDPNLLNGRTVDIERMYDDGVVRTLDRTMERYDKDGNGVLEYEEWREISWQSDPRESDLDKDGRLTRAEMAERYKNRNDSSSSRSSSRSSDRDRGRSRNSDRGSDRGRGSFGGRGGGSGGPPSFGGRSGFGGGPSFGGRGGGGDRGGGDRGGRSGFNPEDMLKRFDRDGDGMIDFSQLPDGVKSFMGSRLGIETSGKAKISDLVKKIQESRGGGNGSNRRGSRGQAEKQETPKSKMIEGADRYEGQYSFRQEKKRVRGMPDWWEDRDENEDGQVTMAEFLASRSRNRLRELDKFDEFDLNRDGIITPAEAEAVDD